MSEPTPASVLFNENVFGWAYADGISRKPGQCYERLPGSIREAMKSLTADDIANPRMERVTGYAPSRRQRSSVYRVGGSRTST